MERICESCGAEPGAGAFCQHCGARLVDEGATEPVIPAPATPPPTAAPQSPVPTPPVVGGQPVAKRKGCRSGCLIAGVIALVLLVVGAFFAWRFFSDEVLPGIEGAVDSATAFSDAPPGPCYDLETENGLLTGWTEVACTGPRQVEVSFAASFEEGAFPGDQYLTDTATDTCPAAFERYVGVSPDQSAYDVDWLLPTEEMWGNGARQGICLVVSDDGSPITERVKGSES